MKNKLLTILPLAGLGLILAGFVYLFGHDAGYNDAHAVYAKIFAEKIDQEEQGIATDCLTKNGFVLNDVTYLCQPIMPIPSYAQ